MNWKYALIKINHESLIDDEYCELVELYDTDGTGVYNAFCLASIKSKEELTAAYNDVTRDGVNVWFSDNGKFTYSSSGHWDWTEYEEDIGEPSVAWEDEHELYKVYGGD